jgi:hypothetical protein
MLLQYVVLISTKSIPVSPKPTYFGTILLIYKFTFALFSQVAVAKPDLKGRREILDLYVNRITHDGIDIDKLAKRTVGFTGADLENMVNTAAIRAAVNGEKKDNNIRLEFRFWQIVDYWVKNWERSPTQSGTH